MTKKYYNYAANGADQEREHRLPMLQKAIGTQAIPDLLAPKACTQSPYGFWSEEFQVSISSDPPFLKSCVTLLHSSFFCWPESNRFLTRKLIQIFNFGIFIYCDVDRKREQKRPYLNHLGKVYKCFCNALISSHRILGVLAEERYHLQIVHDTLGFYSKSFKTYHAATYC